MDRDVMEVDVCFVGAGPANLAAAITLAKGLQEAGHDDKEILVLEKSTEVGDHILSGAIMDPKAMIELLGPEWREKGCPVHAEVGDEAVYTLTPTKAKKLPVVPPTLKNHGGVIVSLSEVVVWLKEQAEELGVQVFEGQPAAEALFDDAGGVKGVRLVDRGRDKNGDQGPMFEPGADVLAKVTVFGEGSRGSLTKQVVDKLDLHGPNPQVYGTGIKEIWDVPAGRIKAGTVYHTAGWPLPNEVYGGSWIYAQSDTRISIGFVTALDGGDPSIDPYETMQRWKTHAFVSQLLDGGTLVKSGAKTVPEGGWWSRPKSHGKGFLIVGDSGSLLNIARLKGIHTAMKSGIMAGETIKEALPALGEGEETLSAEALATYEQKLEASWLKEELWRVRNWRQAFAKFGFGLGKFYAGAMWALGGKLFTSRLPIHTDAEAMKKGDARSGPEFKPDGKLTLDKVTGVYHAGSVHEEDQPSHLVIADTDLCATKCAEEYGNPCERFCPANVYEMVPTEDGSSRRMQINFSNCVHCKTCDIADPYQVITWQVPEDNGGPKYLGL